MTAEDNHRVPLPIELSTGETKRDPQLSAGVNDGAARLVVGQLLGGRYRIERELGEGGMGVVYLAADEQVAGERFAIKVLKQELHPEAVALLREEARKTRKLSHPNIIDVHSVNLDGQRLYVLMEYLEGKSLDALLEEEFGRGMSFSRAWPIIEDVGAALANAHDHNVIHSDLKPANIFVTISGRTKLLDFGIARVSRGPRLQARVGPRALTPAYASCEMLEGQEVNRRDDIYSFACVIYEMLCGERPFGALTALEAQETAAEIPPLEGISREQNAALCQALAFERDVRTGTVEALLAGLAAHTKPRSRPATLVGSAILGAIALADLTYVVLDRLRVSGHPLMVEATTSNTHQAATLAVDRAAAAFNSAPHSIAVLPFVNISGDMKQEYFSDGLSEELIDHLVHSTELQVIARTSSFQFKGKNEDVRSIAHKLAVTHVLEGSVRRDGRHLRITAQLIRGSDGVQMWSQTYDRNLVDIFKIQDEIAVEVSSALHLAFGNGLDATNRHPDLVAYNLILEGRYFEARRTLPNVEKAADLYKQAIDRDPGYALAWARLAHAYLTEEILKGPPTEEQSSRVLDALDQALRRDPNLIFAYYTRGAFEANVTWDWAAAQAANKRMRELEPRSDLLPGAFGDIAFVFGQFDRAIELYQNGLVRNPLDPNIIDSLGVAFCAASRFQRCLETRLRLMQLHPEFDGISSSVAIARLYLGRVNEALTGLRQEPNEDYRLRGQALVYWTMGRRGESDAALNALTDKYASIDPYGIASVHAYRGEIDAAFEWLQRAYRGHDPGMVLLKTDPLLTRLRGDSRLQELLGRMRLTDQFQRDIADNQL